MSDLDKRSKAIIRAAENAVANIRDPKQRAEAKAVLDATMMKLEASMGPRRGSPRARVAQGGSLGKDIDFER